jgi:hypothetical protein
VIRQQRSNNGVAFGLGIAVAGPKHAKTLLYPPVHPKNPTIKTSPWMFNLMFIHQIHLYI